jgi:two-component system response regulator AtoC
LIDSAKHVGNLVLVGRQEPRGLFTAPGAIPKRFGIPYQIRGDDETSANGPTTMHLLQYRGVRASIFCTVRRVLVVDDEENLRLVLRTLLRRHGYEVETAESGEEALGMVDSFGPDVVLTDVRMPKMGGLDLLTTLKAKGNEATVIVMSAYGNMDLALEAMKAGAYDYVQKPFKPDEVVLALRKAEERELLRRENRQLRDEIRKEHRFEDILAKSQKMQDIFRTISKIAEYKTTVLVAGESGVGKELVARAIHHRSSRRGGPFVAVNCGAIPENLLESELFGHKKGAFTDAVHDRRGLFEEADGGSLFLDEIGELPLALQVKLLRVLEDEKIRRVGDTRDLKVDVRIITATHRDLTAETKAGRFREDLFYRLNVLPILVPPLRDRREDIPLLIDHFVARNNSRLGTSIRGLDTESRRLLFEYAWPGNVRELENTIERAMVLAEGDQIVAQDLPDRLREARDPVQMQLASGELSVKKTMRIIEEILIRRALQKTKGNRTRAAEVLEISHRALLYKIKDYQITDL